MRFGGFGDRLVPFYDGLEADNSKPYWTDHREEYEQDVRAPLEALITELEPEFGAGKVFRPYRDVRFSKDKSPYKTAAAAVVHAAGRGVLYVQVSADGLLAAGGFYRAASDQVARLRRAVADDVRGPELERLLAQLVKKGFTIGGETVKTTPRGYPADHPRIDLLKHKSVTAGREWEPDDGLHDRTALTRVRNAWRALAPLNTWLGENVGASAEERR